MLLGLFPERLGGGVESAEYPGDVTARHAERCKFAGHRSGVGAVDRSEATVAATIVGRADRAAPAVGNRTQARRPVRDHDANIAPALAIDADAVIGDRRLASGEKGLDDLEQ